MGASTCAAELSVSYWQAWACWWQGLDVKPLTFHGFPMIWVGRIAKIASFFSAFTVVLDIVGQEWMIRKARRLKEVTEPSFAIGISIVLAIFLGATVASAMADKAGGVKLPEASDIDGLAVGAVAVVFMLFSVGILVAWSIAGALGSPKNQHRVRLYSFMLFAISFHFDLLTS